MLQTIKKTVAETTFLRSGESIVKVGEETENEAIQMERINLDDNWKMAKK